MSSKELQEQKRRTDEILTEFSQICVDSILHRKGFSLEDTKSVMGAMGYQPIADFLTRCFTGRQVKRYKVLKLHVRCQMGLFLCTQIPELLKNDFLGGKPSAAKVLVEMKVFSKASLYCHSEYTL